MFQVKYLTAVALSWIMSRLLLACQDQSEDLETEWSALPHAHSHSNGHSICCLSCLSLKVLNNESEKRGTRRGSDHLHKEVNMDRLTSQEPTQDLPLHLLA